VSLDSFIHFSIFLTAHLGTLPLTWSAWVSFVDSKRAWVR